MGFQVLAAPRGAPGGRDGAGPGLTDVAMGEEKFNPRSKEFDVKAVLSLAYGVPKEQVEQIRICDWEYRERLRAILFGHFEKIQQLTQELQEIDENNIRHDNFRKLPTIYQDAIIYGFLHYYEVVHGGNPSVLN